MVHGNLVAHTIFPLLRSAGAIQCYHRPVATLYSREVEPIVGNHRICVLQEHGLHKLVRRASDKSGGINLRARQGENLEPVQIKAPEQSRYAMKWG